MADKKDIEKQLFESIITFLCKNVTFDRKHF